MAEDPIKIGFDLSQTGPLAPNGKQALLGAKIWEEEVNGKGGLLGRCRAGLFMRRRPRREAPAGRLFVRGEDFLSGSRGALTTIRLLELTLIVSVGPKR